MNKKSKLITALCVLVVIIIGIAQTITVFKIRFSLPAEETLDALYMVGIWSGLPVSIIFFFLARIHNSKKWLKIALIYLGICGLLVAVLSAIFGVLKGAI